MAKPKLFNKLRRELYKLLSRIGLSRAKVDYDGIRLNLPIIGGMGTGHLVSRDLWMTTVLSKFLKSKQGMVVDIGVNIGMYLLKLRSIDLTREYVGFEPNPACNFYTQELIAANNFENSRVFPFALSDEKTMRTFYTLRRGDKMGSLHSNARKEQKGKIGTDLLTHPGDEFFDLLRPESICAIKIDVEGAELEVLKGLKLTIEKHRPYIYCEVWNLPAESDPLYAEKTERAGEIFNLMSSIGYSIYGVEKQNHKVCELSSPLDFDERYLPDYIMVGNKADITVFM